MITEKNTELKQVWIAVLLEEHFNHYNIAVSTDYTTLGLWI